MDCMGNDFGHGYQKTTNPNVKKNKARKNIDIFAVAVYFHQLEPA